MDVGSINPGLATASVLALITFGVHTFVGGVFVARPLLASRELTPASLWLNYYCWHIVSALLLVMSAGFGWAAAHPDARDVAALLTVMAAIFSPLCIWVAIKGGIAPWRFPASWLFALVTAAGLWGFAA